jgi:NAD(P)-dependent dehydrogenase (short-subunit alcohol dehydrogenase family)
MLRRFSDPSIAVSLSTRGAFMPAWMAQHVAAVAGVDGIDVDATSTVGVWLASRSGTADPPYIKVRSIWFPFDGLRSPRISRFLDMTLATHAAEPPMAVVVVPGLGTLRDLSRNVDVTSGTTSRLPLVLGVPSSALRGGRPHLVHLGTLRRFAEEWDLAIAVDLSGRFDPTWEAEAAVARLGDRLRIIRVSASAPSRSAIGRDRVACRALHAAIDRNHVLDVAIASPKSIPFPATPRVASNAARFAARYIAERAAIHAAELREGLGRYEGSSSSRSG